MLQCARLLPQESLDGSSAESVARRLRYRNTRFCASSARGQAGHKRPRLPAGAPYLIPGCRAGVWCSRARLFRRPNDGLLLVARANKSPDLPQVTHTLDIQAASASAETRRAFRWVLVRPDVPDWTRCSGPPTEFFRT